MFFHHSFFKVFNPLCQIKILFSSDLNKNAFEWIPLSEEMCISNLDLLLTLKAPITTAADDINKYFLYCFSDKIRLDDSSESSAGQRIHMKKSSLIFLER